MLVNSRVQANGAESSGYGWSGRVMPLPGNAVLDSVGGFAHLSREDETLNNDLPERLKWETFRSGSTLVRISSTGKNPDRYPLSWTRLYTERFSTKFIGLRLKEEAGAETIFGWISIEVDISSGRISVQDKGFSPGSVVVGQ